LRIPELLLTICRYKAKINIKFLTEELGFESYQETAQFIVDHGAQDALEQDNSSAEAFYFSIQQQLWQSSRLRDNKPSKLWISKVKFETCS
jgi:hypothetical protein